MDIHLNFINYSDDTNNSSVVIFQKNVADPFDHSVIAWEVISNYGRGVKIPFVFPFTLTLAANDGFGNYTPRQIAQNGQIFQVVYTAGVDDALQLTQIPGPSTEVQVRNDLGLGAIDACIYRNGKLLAIWRSVLRGQVAIFEFTPTIWIGVASEVSPGNQISLSMVSNIYTEISLLGVKSADIVMTGGASGGQPITFKLENVVMA